MNAARAELVERGRGKALAPYTLDEELTFFCPQENLEALALPVVQKAHADQRAWAAAPGDGTSSILLLLPCQARKPYPLSPEHLAVNAALLAAGWEPEGPGDWPAQLATHVDDERLLSEAPLWRDGVRLERAVVSEPFALVPYARVYFDAEGAPSPFARYVDPGLFEHRRIAPTWRVDCTARDGRWGEAEREAYIAIHNVLAEHLAAVLAAAAPRYEAIVAYVAPGLTHRSFLAGAEEKRAAGLPTSRRGRGGTRRTLLGVDDLAPGLVQLVPDGAALATLRDAAGGRLAADVLARPAALALLTDRLARAA